jgi:hypothetical protein
MRDGLSVLCFRFSSRSANWRPTYDRGTRTRGRLERLQRDLSDGTWAARHNTLLDQAELGCGYRLVIGLM